MGSRPTHASLANCHLKNSHIEIMAAIKVLNEKMDLQTKAIQLLASMYGQYFLIITISFPIEFLSEL